MNLKKPKFWDYNKPNLFSYLLLPLTIITIINNFFLNKKTKKNVNLIKTVCLGNLYLGGTGKTPTAIKLYEILKSLNFNVAVGKKFYPSHIDEKNILERKAKLIISSSRKKN